MHTIGVNNRLFKYRDQEIGTDGGRDVDNEDFLLAWRGRWNFPSDSSLSPFTELDLGFGRRETDTSTGSEDSTSVYIAAEKED